jgi:hypothetical protein
MPGPLPPRQRRRAIACVLAAAATLGAAPIGTAARPVLSSQAATSPLREIAEGVTYRRMRVRGPVRVHVVRIDPAGASTIDVAPGGTRMGSSARTSAIGRAYGAIVAINGDFGLLRGMPLHAFEADGSLLGRGVQLGTNFAMRDDETASHLDPPAVSIVGRHPPEGQPFDVTRWNSGPPGPATIAAYTAYGGAVVRPPIGGCAVRLVPDSPHAWAPGGAGHTRRFAVDASRCGGARRMRRDPRSVVLASRRWGGGSERLSAMVQGDRVRLTWSPGWQRVADTVGGVPRLVRDGAVVAPSCGSAFCRRHPRTGVGVTADGSVLFVVVDGRAKRSVGMTLRRFGRTFADLGAVDAVNLDGGGSATLWVAGRGVVNRPSDSGGERGVVNALLLLPSGDDGAWHPVRGSPARAIGAAALHDPASTGGLARAWVAGGLVAEPPPRAIERIAVRGPGA